MIEAANIMQKLRKPIIDEIIYGVNYLGYSQKTFILMNDNILKIAIALAQKDSQSPELVGIKNSVYKLASGKVNIQSIYRGYPLPKDNFWV